MWAKKRGKNVAVRTKKRLLLWLLAPLWFASITSFSAPPYPFAILSVSNINFNGNNVRVDSFDSSDTNYSDWNTNWGYGTYVPSKSKANGNVGTDASIIGAISVGQANIYGHIDVGPGGTAEIGNDGYVGPLPQVGIGIQDGYSNDDMTVVVPDVSLPPDAASWQNIPANDVITNSGDYFSPGISNNLVISAPYVRIYVAGAIYLSTYSSITVNTNVACVSIYVGGPSIHVISTGSISNFTQRASAMGFYGLPSLTNIVLGYDNPFIGTIYAPEAAFDLGGGGAATFDVVGAITVQSIRFNGHANFHFDEFLSNGTSSLLLFPARQLNFSTIAGHNASMNITPQGQPMSCQWFSAETGLISGATNTGFTITNAQFTDAGSYYLVATNFSGIATSQPVNLVVYTNLSFSVSPPIIQNGWVSFYSRVPSGFTLTAQVSTNLSDWVSIGSGTAFSPWTNVWYPVIFSDLQPSNSPQRYYRVVFDP